MAVKTQKEKDDQEFADKISAQERKEIQQLREELAEAKAALAKKTQFTLKVSDKGAVSVYGMGRFPVTLYKEQWANVLDHAEEIRSFIRDNNGKLKAKGE
jgi:50S ribosomal subunit-associated GTPase HflX